MKIQKGVLCGLSLAFFAIYANAKPAIPTVVTLTQPDGTELKIRKYGDEFMHFVTLEDGTLVHQDAEGLFTFGRINTEGQVVSTGVPVAEIHADVAKSNIKDIDFDRVISARKSTKFSRSTDVEEGEETARAMSDGPRRSVPQSGMGLTSTGYPVTGQPKGLIILVEYSDVKFTLKNPADYFHDMINGENFTQYKGTGSALAYFTKQSGGKFVPSFDIYGPVTLPNNQKYYGGNDMYGNDMRPEQMVIDAINILDDDVDFSQYDTNHDGRIDNVYIYYAGKGEADFGGANTVWPHSWDINSAGKRLTVDGVAVRQYACSNEWGSNRPDGVGTFVHEFSHVMGLPDLYHTTNASATYTPGYYSVLDYGPYNNDGCTPPNYGAYELNALGWMDPIELTGEQTVSLDQITSGQFALIPTEKTTEFFLLENRQQNDWDKYIPWHGMLIWHIDYVKSVFDRNEVNNTRAHQYVDLVEANNTPDSSSSMRMRGYPFPGSTRSTEFTSETVPALVSWGGKDINLPVTNITETSSGIISFDVCGGGLELTVPVTTVTIPADNPRSFVASWNEVPGARDYLIKVVAHTTPSSVLVDYDEVSTDGATTFTVDQLLDEQTDYYFTVVATDGLVYSAPSVAKFVTVSGMSGVGDIAVDKEPVGTTEYYNLQGVRVHAPAPGSIVIERSGNSVRKILVK